MATWFNSIKTGLVIAGGYELFIIIPIIISIMLIKGGRFNIGKIVMNLLFLLYMSCLFAVVFLPLPTAGKLPTVRHLQMIPGFAIIDIVNKPCVRSVAQVLFNIVMTMPFGAYLRYYLKKDVKKAALCTLALSLFIEIAQYTGLFFIYEGSYRFCDVDDLICNTLGGFIGAFLTSKCTFLPELDQFVIYISKGQKVKKIA